MSIDFVAVDVETANSDRGSICSKKPPGVWMWGNAGRERTQGNEGW